MDKSGVWEGVGNNSSAAGHKVCGKQNQSNLVIRILCALLFFGLLNVRPVLADSVVSGIYTNYFTNTDTITGEIFPPSGGVNTPEEVCNAQPTNNYSPGYWAIDEPVHGNYFLNINYHYGYATTTCVWHWIQDGYDHSSPVAQATSGLTCPANASITFSQIDLTHSCNCDVNYQPDRSKLRCVPPNTSDPAKNNGCDSYTTTAKTNPCNAGTGNKFQQETDYVGVGDFPLKLERLFNSGASSPSTIDLVGWGSQWRSNYDRTFFVGGDFGIGTIKREGGNKYYYNKTNGAWVGDADVIGSLVQQYDGNGNVVFSYTNMIDEVETYVVINDITGKNFKLISIKNKAGLTQTLTYSCTVVSATCPVVTPANIAPVAGLLLTVTDPAGRQLNYTYDSASRVNKMTDPSGGIYTYTYSGPLVTDNLVSVTYPDNKTRTYLYGEVANVSATPDAGVSYAHALTGIIDENGTRYASWTYDAQGRATSSEHGAMGSGIDHVGLTYTAPDTNGNSTTSVVDVQGTARTYTFSTILGVVKNTGITGLPCNGCSSAFAYDPNGNVTSRTDFNGNVTTYIYDLSRNLELSRTEASGTPQARTITTQWHPTYRLPTLVIEPLRSTSYTYDPQGNLLTLAILPVPGIGGGAGQPRITHYSYNPFGQVLTVDGPRTDVNDTTNYEYDPQGNLVRVTNALGHTTQLGNYDPNGRVGLITNPNGLTTYLTYDPRGRLTHRTAGSDNTHYTYDGVGNLTNVALPNGALYTYTYDAAHRLIQIADAQNNRIVYTLDNAGNRIREETFDTAGNLIQTHRRVFDALNRLWQDIGAVNQTTTYMYDPNGNVTSIDDPLHRLSTNTYDALNRLSQVTNPDLGIIQYAYDPQHQLIAVTDPRNNTTQYQRDGLGNLNQTQSPDTGATLATYDEAGNLKTKLDAKGQLATYSYDALNRLTNIDYTAGAGIAFNVTYLYDQGINGTGHLSGMLDNTGVTQYSYDSQGRLIAEARQSMSGAGNGLIYTTSYNYDPLGRLNTTTYPSGRSVNYSYDPMGRISTISTTDTSSNTTVIASNIQYRPFGGVQSYTYGDGQVALPQTQAQTYTRQYDQDGRIASYSQQGQPIIIGYDAASQISFINNMGGPITLPSLASYSYDPMSRLTGYTQGSLNQSYNYDSVGNRTSQLIGSTNTSYGIDPLSNKLASMQSGAGAPQVITQDATGTTTSDATRNYAYDVRGRLIQATTAQGTINYEVNALGLRVRKHVPYANSDTQYHYDSMGHLIGENTTGTTQFSREYIWLGDIPVAVMQ